MKIPGQLSVQINTPGFQIVCPVLGDHLIEPEPGRTPATGLLRGCRILTIEARQQDLLGRCPGRKQGQHAIGSEGVLPQQRAAVGRPVHHDEDLAACRSHLEAEAPKRLVSVHLVGRTGLQVINHRLDQLERWHLALIPMLPACHIGNAANETSGIARPERPMKLKSYQTLLLRCATRCRTGKR